jgi:hypothetical protein
LLVALRLEASRVAGGGLALGIALVVAVTPGCGGRRTAEEQAAVRAQDACITALEPVSKDQRPSTDALATAARDAEAAAKVDERWMPLRARVLDFGRRTDDRESLDALVKECERVNRIVKEKRGDVQPGASG